MLAYKPYEITRDSCLSFRLLNGQYYLHKNLLTRSVIQGNAIGDSLLTPCAYGKNFSFLVLLIVCLSTKDIVQNAYRVSLRFHRRLVASHAYCLLLLARVDVAAVKNGFLIPTGPLLWQRTVGEVLCTIRSQAARIVHTISCHYHASSEMPARFSLTKDRRGLVSDDRV